MLSLPTHRNSFQLPPTYLQATTLTDFALKATSTMEEKPPAAPEYEEGLPPDVKKALAERGMTEAQALRMMEQRGATLAEVRGFLGLPEPEEKPAAQKPEGKSEKSEADKA